MVDTGSEETPILLKLSPVPETDGGTEDEVFPLPVVLIVDTESCRDCKLIELRESPELML